MVTLLCDDCVVFHVLVLILVDRCDLNELTIGKKIMGDNDSMTLYLATKIVIVVLWWNDDDTKKRSVVRVTTYYCECG